MTIGYERGFEKAVGDSIERNSAANGTIFTYWHAPVAPL